MLKRLSASLNPSPSPSLTPSHSSSSIAIPSFYGADGDRVEHLYPRPSGMSTPYSSSNNLEVAHSNSMGYFGQQVSSSSSAASSSSSLLSAGGRLSPAISTAVSLSRNASPLPSPRLSYSPIPSEGANGTYITPNTASHSYGTYIPPPPIDRPTLQKSLKCLETLLVAVDEYRELNARLAKVEKRLGKAAKELCASMSSGGKDDANGIGSGGGSGKGKDGGNAYFSTCHALNLSSNLFEVLSETSTKFSRSLIKEYDSLNEACSKSFKKIAKEERVQDDLLESLDNKLKKANYAYDKKIRSSAPGSTTATNTHEQFVPLLSQLTEEINKSKINHCLKMAIRRDEIVKNTARNLTNLAENEFRKHCEMVRKLGSLIGNVLAVQALLGYPTTSANAGSAGGNGTLPQEMPNIWPEELPTSITEVDELGRMGSQQDLQYLDAKMQSQQQQQLQGHIHPLASPHLSETGERATAHSLSNQLHQNQVYRPPRTLDDLLPSRAPFTTDLNIASDGTSRSRKGSDANIPPPRSVSLNHLNDEIGNLPSASASGKYGSISSSSSSGNAHASGGGIRSVSFPVEQMRSGPAASNSSASAVMNHDATVTLRNAHTRSSVDPSFFPSSSERRTTVTNEVGGPNDSRKETDTPPTLRQGVTKIRSPALQPALSYSPSQSAKIGYFGNRDTRQLSEVAEEDRERQFGRGGEQVAEEGASFHRIPVGFVMEETSPEYHRGSKQFSQAQAQGQGQRVQNQRVHGHIAHSRSSPESASQTTGTETEASPTLSLATGANSSSTSYSRNLSESYNSHQQASSLSDDAIMHASKGSNANAREGYEENTGGFSKHPSGTQLERSVSIESTASEQSFVARMKARYAEEREARKASEHVMSSAHAGRADDTTTPSSRGGDNGRPSSSRRVSMIAQAWEEKSQSSHGQQAITGHGYPSSSSASASVSSRPSQQHRASMPTVMSSSWNGRNIGGRSDVPRHRSTGARVVHSSICQCDDCDRL